MNLVQQAMYAPFGSKLWKTNGFEVVEDNILTGVPYVAMEVVKDAVY